MRLAAAPRPQRAAAETVELAYRRRARRYDAVVALFSLLRPIGFDIEGWRRAAVGLLRARPGDTVVDLGCGTGLNFSLLRGQVGEAGTIVGVDLSASMLEKARQRVVENGWENVTLVQCDAARFEFPPDVGGVISTLALTLVGDCGRVIERASDALAPGRSCVVLDMAWPRWCPRWWRHMLFFLRSYGVTGEVIARRPWDTVWETMGRRLTYVSRAEFWMGFFYLASGTHAAPIYPEAVVGRVRAGRSGAGTPQLTSRGARGPRRRMSTRPASPILRIAADAPLPSAPGPAPYGGNWRGSPPGVV